MVFGRQSLQEKESNRWHADEVRVENIPRNHNVGPPREVQSLMRDLQCEPELFNGRIILMSMYNDIAWQEKGNKERCEYNSQTVAKYARKFPRGHWSFLGPGSDKKWYGTSTDKPDHPRTEWQRIW